uniref:Lipocalin n=1 Tax=Angiostrongylus cantonensis TaxID=6313 RepID=A0A0K0DC47_ANGCA
MVVIFVLLVVSVPTDGHGVFDSYLNIGEMEMNRTITFENGTTWTMELKEGVKIYGRENMPTGNEIFQCAYVGQPGYDSIEVKTGCVAAQLLNVEEKVSCSSVTFTYGITSKENVRLTLSIFGATNTDVSACQRYAYSNAFTFEVDSGECRLLVFTGSQAIRSDCRKQHANRNPLLLGLSDIALL